MAKHFGAQHMKNGYAAMGGNPARPIYGGIASGRSVAQAIAEERARAARAAKVAGGKKK